MIVVNGVKVDYTPALGFDGTDTFKYIIKDGEGAESTATVTVTVEEEVVDVDDRRLRANPDAISFNQNSSDNVIYVLADNGSGADDFGSKGAMDGGLTMTSGGLTGKSDRGGIISVDNKTTDSPEDDVIMYTPKSGFIGEDSFKYKITDSSGDTSITIVTITVVEIAKPTAVDDTVSITQNSGLKSIEVLDNDSFGLNGKADTDYLTLSEVESSLGGSIAVNGSNIDYTPLAISIGTDTFTYTITDTEGNKSTANVTIEIGEDSIDDEDDEPTASDDAVAVSQNSSDNLIHISLDDFGSDGPHADHPISLYGTRSVNGGKLVVDGLTIKYTPRTDFLGLDNFKYLITDADGDASQATLTITVVEYLPKNDVDSNNEFKGFTVYPNPSNGYVKSSLFSEVNTIANVYLFDVTGKVVYDSVITIKKGNNEFDLKVNVKPGIMFIKIVSSQVNFGTSKIVFK